MASVAPMAKNLAVLLFPPNWSVCTNGPHLALPLLAGAARHVGWTALTWDLSRDFYQSRAQQPTQSVLCSPTERHDYSALDKIYFAWEDQLRQLDSKDTPRRFCLLSGFAFPQFENVAMADIARDSGPETVYRSYYDNEVAPRLQALQPSVVGVTVASIHQLIPTIELLRLLREWLPDVFIVLGGNVITRLRHTSAFETLQRLVDQVVVFQGDLAFRRLLLSVQEIGAIRSRQCLPRIAGDQAVPFDAWPIPHFSGLDLTSNPGIPVLSYVSTRGCYWGKCHFCAIPAGWSESGYGGSAPSDLVVRQLRQVIRDTGIRRVKFVDEAISPSKIRHLAPALASGVPELEWEGYARLERAWEDPHLLTNAHTGGLRKLYFGLEQAPTTDRSLLNKNDRGDILRIMHASRDAGIRVHLFCMVGHPGTTADDAKETTDFLISHQHLIDTADLVGFRLDRGTTVPGVRALSVPGSDWGLSFPYEPTIRGGLSPEDVSRLETHCQERLWQHAPRLLHPLYRLLSPWQTDWATNAVAGETVIRECSVNCSLIP